MADAPDIQVAALQSPTGDWGVVATLDGQRLLHVTPAASSSSRHHLVSIFLYPELDQLPRFTRGTLIGCATQLVCEHHVAGGSIPDSKAMQLQEFVLAGFLRDFPAGQEVADGNPQAKD